MNHHPGEERDPRISSSILAVFIKWPNSETNYFGIP